MIYLYRLLLISLFFFPAILQAQFRGLVHDAQTREPVPFAYVHLAEINRTATADKEGLFFFQNVPPGTYTLSIHRIGYKTYTSQIRVEDETGMTEPDLFLLTPESVVSEEITVTGQAEEVAGSRLQHASSKIIGENLRRNLGSTLAETMKNEPGFNERSLGPAPGRPVIRGLGDERVLILQDGERTGDVSSQSADHAVSVDPMGAEEIEIARGPAALAYGANAIGGVINVVKNQISTSVPSDFSGTLSLLGQTVNSEAAASVDASIPYRDWVVNLDLNGKNGTDYSAPGETITNSYLKNSQNTIGISRVGNSGYVGASASYYVSRYGIPPDPNGGHPNGVDIEMDKLQFDVRAERIFRNSFISLLEARYSFVNYDHSEIESNGTLGTRFGNLSTNVSLKGHNRSWWIFDNGSFGLWGELLDYAVIGARTPESNQYSGAAYMIQEGNSGNLHYEVGTRFEYVLSKPDEQRVSPRIGLIEQREFAALATSASLIYGLTNTVFLGTTAIHSFRPPSLEELYSEGPHLAAYSFEIGNPQLDAERGLGLELFLRHNSNRFQAQLTGYSNLFSNYLYARDTGEQSISDPSLNNYQFVGEEARFLGVEFSGEVRITPGLTAGGMLSYTFAERNVSEEEQNVTGFTGSTRPLPMIPPIQGSLFVRQEIDNFTVSTRFSSTGRQTRVGEFETPTDGFNLLNASVQYRFSTSGLLHTISLRGSNLLNTTYRNHLSRIKEVFPAPGRNVSLLYRVYF
ncbi:TonB-dependent receptor [Rhodohalobacter mucosus]|uniref:TonB-dependent receptor n=1 Tax=Rhodohalobacter mucosus TaxID=2079485 RepID=A0A316U264_9BACT|nr:TonB-dependent receptor [Rhodohalobacter mucosus]PWN07216.1 TonB-dependent receptor [Rhodohalobacter mucosus]